MVLFGHPPAERAGEIGTPERPLYRRAARFDAAGMVSLVKRILAEDPPPPRGDDGGA